MSYPQQPGRPGPAMPVPPQASAIRPQYQGVPPQARGIPPQTRGIAPQTYGIAPQAGGIPPLSSTYTHAPTLGQFWRSDVRHTSLTRRPVRWPGLLAFFGGLAALVLLIAGLAATSVALVSVALAFSAVAGFFAIVALIAGLGRGLGFVGLLLALAGNVYVVGPLFGLG
jgi:hypothetical protein